MKQRWLVIVLTMINSFIVSYNKYHISILKDILAQKKMINVSGCDFRGTDSVGAYSLREVDLSGGQISGALFSMPTKESNVDGIVSIPNQKSDLTGSKFKNAECVSTDFSNAILRKSNFNGANIAGANFSGADLTGAKFKKVKNARTAVFCGATMPDGTKCTGTTWKNKSKSVTLYCNCPQKKQ
ncbi:pentapeptide repeat-containing protein [Candidatus Dependentiae bacterium]|nr:pentapeptide repeat-containing protein [Candidatus Dependentiae bacterium]